MTTSTSDSGNFQRELLLWAFGDVAKKALEEFESTSTSELQLAQWQEQKISSEDPNFRIWWQKNLAKSRKQVAPLLRDAMDSPDAKL